MQIEKVITVLWVLLISISLQAQKKILSHDDLVTWNRISDHNISNDGSHVLYRLTKEVGDPILHIYNAANQSTWKYPRAYKPTISADSRFVCFLISPAQDSIKMLKRRKIKDKDMPKDSLGILNLNTMELVKIPNVKSFELPEKWSDWVVYQLEPYNPKKSINSETATDNNPKKKVKKESDENGSRLIVKNLNDGFQDTIAYVTNYILAAEKPALALTSSGNESTFLNGVYAYDFESRNPITVLDLKGDFKKLSFDRNGIQLAFIGDVDTTDLQIRPFELYTWRHKGPKATVINTNSIRDNNWIISETANLQYAKNGQKLFFGIAQPPILQDTNLLKEEIVNVEVWNYQDGRLYTEQESRLKRDREKSYLSVLDTKNGRVRQLSTLGLPQTQMSRDRDEKNIILYDDSPYLQESTWEGYALRDVYSMNIETGVKTIIGKGLQGSTQMSPSGKFAYWYSAPDTSWISYNINQKEIHRITNNEISKFYDELNDRPMHPRQSGMAGFNKEEDVLFIYDRFDIWNIDPNGQRAPKRLTRGREIQVTYRYISTDRENQYVEQDALVSTFNNVTKEYGIGRIDWSTGKVDMIEEGKQRIRFRGKAKNTDRMLITKEDFNTFPDLILTNSNLNNQKTISKANPQQSEYNWGKMEMVTWTSLDGDVLQGLLLKPEDFDPDKKYPMIVNFYERNSNGLYNHRPPSAGRSTINYPFYASKGYLIFNPDIPYKTGYPGESCYNAVMPGVTKLIAAGFVDEKNIALQGHSWGGYQIAYMVTRSNMFKCAEAGAPVVNMFSAYGGIRWGSGRSRMFQYERTQSRIGGTIWEYPLRYLENSPLFFIDKVQTPLLILHNDEDSAVPWYQGIEMFGALRRLGKPAWMLNYNGEPHWPVKLQNRRDFNVRMQQFFDHYLLGSPMPEWMSSGVSPLNKGINQGLEISKE